MNPLRVGRKYFLRPLGQIGREWFKYGALAALALQFLILVRLALDPPNPQLQQLIFAALGIAFVASVAAYLHFIDTIIEIDTDGQNATIRHIGFSKNISISHAIETCALEFVERWEKVRNPESGEVIDQRTMQLLLRVPDHPEILLAKEIDYIQWPVFFEKEAQKLSLKLGINLVYQTPKPEKLLSQTYDSSR